MQIALKIEEYGYYPLTTSFLDICDKPTLATLEDIDEFTKKFTEDEIIESAKKSGIIVPENKKIKLVIFYIQNKTKKECKEYTKDDIEFLEFDVLDFFKDNISNKDVTNQLKNFFECKNYIPEDLTEFVLNINTVSIIQILHGYANLSYYSRRLLKEYIYEKIVPRLDKDELKRKREI